MKNRASSYSDHSSHHFQPWRYMQPTLIWRCLQYSDKFITFLFHTVIPDTWICSMLLLGTLSLQFSIFISNIILVWKISGSSRVTYCHIWQNKGSQYNSNDATITDLDNWMILSTHYYQCVLNKRNENSRIVVSRKRYNQSALLHIFYWVQTLLDHRMMRISVPC